MKFLSITFIAFILFLTNGDPKKDLTIMSSSGNCDTPLKFKKIRNNSNSKTIIAVIIQKITVEHTTSSITIIDTLKPKEVKNLDCGGCIINGPSQECTTFSIKSATYLKP